jgi:hypothetical protein
LNGFRGTIHFQGPLPTTTTKKDPKTGAIISNKTTIADWYGVEWDDPSRGKHSGTHPSRGDEPLFKVRVEGSGSFIKVSNDEIEFAQNFREVLRSKYEVITKSKAGVNHGSKMASSDVSAQDSNGDGVKDGVVYFGGDSKIEVTTVGWEKVSKKLSKLAELKEVGVAAMQVGWPFKPESSSPEDIAKCMEEEEKEIELISQTTPSIIDLDLSKNLFESWNEVSKLCRGLKKLESLRLNHNRLLYGVEPPGLVPGCFDSIKSLALNGTLLSWKSMLELAVHFPNLTELHFGFNELSVLEDESTEPLKNITFPNLRLLNLESNHLKSWNEVSDLTQRHLPVLETLFLNNNIIEQFEASSTQFTTLKTLNISHNQIKSWRCIHSLNNLKTVTHLRLRHNSVLLNDPLPPIPSTSTAQQTPSPPSTGIDLNDFDAVPKTSQMELMARLGNLTHLNNALITPRERLDAELYYLSRCVQLKQEWDSKFPTSKVGPTSTCTKEEWDQLFYEWHPRLKQIADAQGGMPEAPPASVTSTILKDRLMMLKIVEVWMTGSTAVDVGTTRGKTFDKKVPTTMTVRALKVVVGRLFGLKGKGIGVGAGNSAFKLKAVYKSDETDGEAGGPGGALKILDMDDELRELGYYDLMEGDEIWVEFL